MRSTRKADDTCPASDMEALFPGAEKRIFVWQVRCWMKLNIACCIWPGGTDCGFIYRDFSAKYQCAIMTQPYLLLAKGQRCGASRALPSYLS
ncbi:hypothetical protein KCP71_02905 [Salmonella enterica subsp. enterica]|nr:hypothetical protein KCP71_02905 [Salmonella enterica subsp. enterica]